MKQDWNTAYLPEICEIKTGKHDANHAVNDGKYRFYTCSSEYSRCNTTNFSGESVIVPGNGDIGLVFYYNGDFDAYQRTYVLNNIKINAKFLYYHMLHNWRSRNENKQFGSTIRYVRMSNFTNYTISFPASYEQQRIVSKIEELFSKLDKGVEELNKIKEQLKIYRQAVLKEAFEGKFLSSNSVPRYYFLENFIEKPRYGTSKKCSYENDNSTPVYRIPNIDIQRNTINKEDLKFAKFNETEFEPLALNEGDILIIRSNGSVSLVGRAAIIQKQDLSGLFAGYLMRLRIRDFSKLNPKYLIHFLNSHEARTYIEQTAKSTSGVNNINSNEICALKVPIFTLDEQNAIIREIESRLSVCEKVEQTVNQSLQKAESLRQSILKQAFEGKLV